MALTEATIIAIANVVKAALEHNMKLMEVDLKLALAGLRRLERFMEQLDKLFNIDVE